MKWILTVTAGEQAGRSFPLLPEQENRIGRSRECEVQLADPLCSRIHASLIRDQQAWRIRDGSSRNGTFVNGRSVHEALLDAADCIRVGGTELAITEREDSAVLASAPADQAAKTPEVVRRADVAGLPGPEVLPAPEQLPDLLLLYQLAVGLLGAADPMHMVRKALELLHGRTGATRVAFLWRDATQRLRPALVLPEDASPDVDWNEGMVRLVLEERQAVWTAAQRAAQRKVRAAEIACHDALCVPLVQDRQALGALHIDLERGNFQQSHFEFAISVANITATALSRHSHAPRHDDDVWPLIVGAGSTSPTPLSEQASQCVASADDLLLVGPPGTGKRTLAELIHRRGPRGQAPLTRVAAVQLAQLASQAADAAAARHVCRQHWAQCAGEASWGALLVDDLSQLPWEAQEALVEWLTARDAHSPTTSSTATSHVRLLVTSPVAPEALLADNRLHRDLHARLRQRVLRLPALSERGSDVAWCCERLLEHLCQTQGRPRATMSPAAREAILAYNWPGNLRQMRAVLEAAVAVATNHDIDVAQLPLTGHELPLDATLRLDLWERRLIETALERVGGNVPAAAKLLGIGRATLYRKIEEYGLKR